MMRMLVLLVAVACLAGVDRVQPANAQQAAVPILIELFTSEGCSSCPPADAWLEKLDASQPIPGAQAIVLSEHVDYWDHDGWKDPYSSSLLTNRQNDYARVLGISSPYTPQLIADGSSELRLSDPQQLNQILLRLTAAPMVPVSIGAVGVEGSAPRLLKAHIQVDGTSEKHNADIYAAITLRRAASQVLRGENGGRHLTHVSVVEELVKIGKMEKGKVSTQDFQAKLKPDVDPKNLRLVVFVQEPNLGKIIGAALQQSNQSDR